MPYLKRLWEPHPHQREILNHGARHRVVAAGRRFGKTKMARGALIEFGFENPGGYSWFVAPNATDAFELGFEPMLEEIPDSQLLGGPDGQKFSAPQEIYLTNGHRYQFRGAGAHGRGRGLDLVVVDEAGEQENALWNQVLRPSLIPTEPTEEGEPDPEGGRLLAVGTPKGRNWFHEMYLRGQDPDDEMVASWQKSSYKNPHIPDHEIEAERATMPERVFRQEYLAEFLTDEGSVFGDVRSRNCRPYHVEDVTGAAPFSTGVDLGRASNYMVATTLDSDGMLVGFLRDRGFSWETARRRITQYLEAFPGTCAMDASRDNAVVEDIARATTDVAVESFKFTRQSKADLVENLAARLETGEIILPESSQEAGDGRPRPTDALLAEMDAFAYETTAAGNVSYGAPEGHHDDAVDALALAARHTKPARMGWA